MIEPYIFIPQQGALSGLTAWLAGDLGNAWARLYVNNLFYVPTVTSADFDEAAWAGYVPINPIAWGPIFLNPQGRQQTDSPVLTYHFNLLAGSQAVYGAYLTDVSQSMILAVMPFIKPFFLSPGRPKLLVTWNLVNSSEL